MRVLGRLGIILFAVILLACAIAPAVHIGLRHLLGNIFGITYFLHVPFDRLLSRVLLVLAFIFLFLARRKLEIQKTIRGSLARSPGWERFLTRGFLLGVASLGLLLLLADLGGAVVLHAQTHSTGAIVMKGFKALLTAFAVGFIEEIFFRGFILQTLQREINARWALLISSVVYALLHFFKSPEHVELNSIQWGAGFTTLLKFAAPFGDLATLIPGVIGLTLVGLVLGIAYQRTGTLYLSIGLHAGWVFFIKFQGVFASHLRGPGMLWFGDERMVSGIVAWVVLLAVGALVHKWGPGLGRS